MESIEQKLEVMEEVQENLLEKVKHLEEQVPEYPKIQIPDYTPELKLLCKQLQAFIQSDHQQKLNNTVQNIEVIIDRIPKVMAVKNHHHFELKSKIVSIIFLTMVTGLVISIFFAIHFKNKKNELQSNNIALQRNNANLEDEAVNYYLVRAHFPEIEKIITRNIRKDKSGYIQRADEIIETRKKIKIIK